MVPGPTSDSVPFSPPATAARRPCGTCGGADARTAGSSRLDNLPAFQPALFARVFADLALHPVDAFRFFLPTPGAALAWLEWLNKGEVFLLVSQNARILGLPSSGPWPLQPYVARAFAGGEFRAVWSVEGLGHDYTDSLWGLQGSPPRGVLTDPSLADLPAASLLMLHAGVGLAYAQRLFDELGGRPGDSQLAATVDRVLDLCLSSSRPGYVGAAYESMGLVARTFHPHLVRRIDAVLRRRDETIADFYWHGVGRALFFLPVSFLPCGQATWRAFRMALDEAPDARARANAIAGMSWATVLVNQRQPAIMADLLRRHGSELASLVGFSEGVLGSIVMRDDTTPGAPFTRELCAFRPRGPELAALWQSAVAEPCFAAIDRVRPRLAAEGRLDEVFRYVPRAVLEKAR